MSTSVPFLVFLPAAADELLLSMLAPTSFEHGFVMSTFAVFEVRPSPSLTVYENVSSCLKLSSGLKVTVPPPPTVAVP